MSIQVGTTTSIVIPSLSQIHGLLGSQSTALPREVLASKLDAELFDTLVEVRRDMDERFDAALILRGREKEPALMHRLLALVEASTRAGDGETPGYTFDEKKTGILAALALQGQITETPDLFDTVREWVLDYQLQAEAEGCQPHGADAPKPRLPAKVAAADERSDKLHRAMVVLGSPRTEKAIGFLLNCLTDESTPESAKIFALHALGGVNHPLAAEAFIFSIFTPEAPALPQYEALEVLANYRPENADLEAALRGAQAAAEQEALRANLKLESPSSAKAFAALLARTLAPRFSSEESAEAQEQLAARIWRPLLHLHSPESRLYPLPDGNLWELAPPGTQGDLLTWRRVRL